MPRGGGNPAAPLTGHNVRIHAPGDPCVDISIEAVALAAHAHAHAPRCPVNSASHLRARTQIAAMYEHIVAWHDVAPTPVWPSARGGMDGSAHARTRKGGGGGEAAGVNRPSPKARARKKRKASVRTSLRRPLRRPPTAASPSPSRSQIDYIYFSTAAAKSLRSRRRHATPSCDVPLPSISI